MKFLFEFIPLLGFLITLLYSNLYTATAVLMILMTATVTVYWILYRRFENIQMITLVLVLVFGTATLVFKNPIFIKWKPTFAYWLFALFFLFTQFISKKPLIQRLLGDKITLPEKNWNILNFSWTVFFLILGGLNLYFVYYTSDMVWAKFKVFGGFGLTLLFALIQGLVIHKHLKNGTS